MSGFRLHEDDHFHYEIIRSLGSARYYGSDILETLNTVSKIKAGDFDSWYKEWSGLAERVLATVDPSQLDKYQATTIRNVFFKASHYYFVADFFLHRNWEDPRSQEAFNLWRKYFDIANAHLPRPGQHAKISASFGEIPVIVYQAENATPSDPKPTVILSGGFDSNMEELMHFFGFDLLERGYNVVLYEGPGQPSFLRDQHVGFIYDWERVVTPIVDHIFAHKDDTLNFIDTKKIGLLGMSLGGYLAARAAAFEPRLTAVMCIDGVYDFLAAAYKIMPQLVPAFEAGNETEFNELFAKVGNPTALTAHRWIHDHLALSFQEKSAFRCWKRAAKMTLAGGVAERIKMPAFIGDATKDIFFKGQPPCVAEAIGSHATLFEFTDTNDSSEHCAAGAYQYQNQVIWEWFARVVG